MHPYIHATSIIPPTFIHPSIHPLHSSIHPSIDRSIPTCIHTYMVHASSIHPYLRVSIHTWYIHPSIYTNVHPYIHATSISIPYIHLPIIFMHPSIHPSIHRNREDKRNRGDRMKTSSSSASANNWIRRWWKANVAEPLFLILRRLDLTLCSCYAALTWISSSVLCAASPHYMIHD